MINDLKKGLGGYFILFLIFNFKIQLTLLHFTPYRQIMFSFSTFIYYGRDRRNIFSKERRHSLYFL